MCERLRARVYTTSMTALKPSCKYTRGCIGSAQRRHRHIHVCVISASLDDDVTDRPAITSAKERGAVANFYVSFFFGTAYDWVEVSN